MNSASVSSKKERVPPRVENGIAHLDCSLADQHSSFAIDMPPRLGVNTSKTETNAKSVKCGKRGFLPSAAKSAHCFPS